MVCTKTKPYCLFRFGSVRCGLVLPYWTALVLPLVSFEFPIVFYCENERLFNSVFYHLIIIWLKWSFNMYLTLMWAEKSKQEFRKAKREVEIQNAWNETKVVVAYTNFISILFFVNEHFNIRYRCSVYPSYSHFL